MFSVPAIRENFSWPSFTRKNFSDLTARLSEAAPGYFRDIAPAAVALGSAYLSSQSFKAGCCVLVGSFVVGHWGLILVDDLRSKIFTGEIQKEEVPKKAEYAASRNVYGFMIGCALIAGVFAAATKSYLVSGGSFFYAAAQTRNVFSLLYGIEDVAIGLAYGAYYAKNYFSRALFLMRAAGPLQEEFKLVISEFQKRLNELNDLNERHKPNKDQIKELFRLRELHQLTQQRLLNQEQLTEHNQLKQLYQLDEDQLKQLGELSISYYRVSQKYALGDLFQQSNQDKLNTLYRKGRLQRLNQLHQLDQRQLNQLYQLNQLHELDQDQISLLYQLNQLHQMDQSALRQLCELNRLNKLNTVGKEGFMERTKKKLDKIFSAYSWNFDDMMEVSSYLSAPLVCAHFAYQAPNLSDLQILEIVDRVPLILTLKFLVENLPEQRFRAIFMPRPTTSERLNEIRLKLETDLETLKKPMHLPKHQDEFYTIASKVEEYLKEVASFLNCLKKISGITFPTQSLQDEIDQARLLEGSAKGIFDMLTNEQEGSLKKRISEINRLIVRSEDSVDDSADETKEVLAYKYLFNEADCAQLAEKLGLTHMQEKNIWDELAEYLNEKGLPDKKALINEGIIPKDEALQRADKKAEVTERIVNFCKSLDSVSWTQILKKIASVSFAILQTGLFCSQMYLYPVPTLIGAGCAFSATLIILVKYNPKFNPPLLSSPTSPDVYGLATRVSRELFSCSYLRGGFFYGLWVGINVGFRWARVHFHHFYPQEIA